MCKISRHCCERPIIAAQMHTWFSSMRSWLTSPWLQSYSPVLTDAITSTFVGTLSILILLTSLCSVWIYLNFGVLTCLHLSSEAFCSVSAFSARSMAFSLSSLSICIFFLMASIVAGWSSVLVEYEIQGSYERSAVLGPSAESVVRLMDARRFRRGEECSWCCLQPRAASNAGSLYKTQPSLKHPPSPPPVSISNHLWEGMAWTKHSQKHFSLFGVVHIVFKKGPRDGEVSR